jgi:hypothetical protein
MTEPQDHDSPSELGSPNPSTGEPPASQVPDMPFHPLAEIFPLPGEDELRAMADDIATHGLREPIVTQYDQILDGRCRYLSCKMAGVEPRFENYVGNDPIAYVYSRNIRRRQPSDVMPSFRDANYLARKSLTTNFQQNFIQTNPRFLVTERLRKRGVVMRPVNF